MKSGGGALLLLGAAVLVSVPASAGLRSLTFSELESSVGEAPLLERLFAPAELSLLHEKTSTSSLSFDYRVSRLLGVPFSRLSPSSRIAAVRFALDEALGPDKASKAAILSDELKLPPHLALRIFE